MRAQLRPYQLEGVNGIRAQFAAGARSVLYVLPTGGGKTYTYSYIAEHAGARGNRVLILEHRKELIRQASLSLATLDVHHQIVAPADKIAAIRRAQVERVGWPLIERDAHVAIASVQTLGRRMEWLADFAPRLVIVDEAHHAVAGTWARIIEACPQACLLGVTATPVRHDGRGLGDVFQRMVLGPSMRELIAQGALVPPRVVAPPTQLDLSAVHTRGGDYDAGELTTALDKPRITGDAVEHYRRLAAGKAAIVFCASIRHAEHVAEEFQRAGFRFHVIHGGMDDAERDRLIFGMAEGTVQGLVSVDVISEGTDIPVAEVAILLRPTQSEALFLQQVGRVLRPAEGKTYGLIIDHVGNTGRWVGGQFVRNHGLPDDERAWSLAGRRRRKRAEAEEEKAPPIRQCPQCYAVHDPAARCPECGHVYATAAGALPVTAEGELREVTADAAGAARIEQRRQQGRAQSVEQMVAQLGYSRDRAAHILAAREEKERLRSEVAQLAERWSRATGRPVREMGASPADVQRMKPKELRARIEALRAALWDPALEQAFANDNGFSVREAG